MPSNFAWRGKTSRNHKEACAHPRVIRPRFGGQVDDARGRPFVTSIRTRWGADVTDMGMPSRRIVGRYDVVTDRRMSDVVGGVLDVSPHSAFSRSKEALRHGDVVAAADGVDRWPSTDATPDILASGSLRTRWTTPRRVVRRNVLATRALRRLPLRTTGAWRCARGAIRPAGSSSSAGSCRRTRGSPRRGTPP